MPKSWTQADLDTLDLGWRDGLSSTEIARQVGKKRGAVTGMRRRLGLPPRTGERRTAAERRQGKTCGTGLRTEPKQVVALGVARANRMGPLAGSTPRPWEQRAYGECCFPVDGEYADTCSCCLPVAKVAGLYCPGHVAILAGHPWPPIGV